MPTGRRRESGFSYLTVVMMVGLVGLGLAAAGTLWHTESQREREADLLFVGSQYRQAIRSYYLLEPAVPRLPASVDDLLEDRRRPEPVRHLRRAWRDPLTGDDFVLIQAPEGRGIVGVHSPSTARPFKTQGFQVENAAFELAESYQAWQFVFVPPAVTPSADGSGR
jgi:type II secretory pathway pseudopilin PulG